MQVTDLAVQAIGSKQTRLTWGTATYAPGYVVFRGLDAIFANSVQIADVDPNTGLYNDYDLTPGTAYWYWVLIPAGTPEGPVTVATGAVPVAGPTYRSLMDALYDWAAGVVGNNVKVVWPYMNGPKPLKPFIELMLTGPLKVPATDHPTEAGQMLSGMRRWTVTVHCLTDPIKPNTGTDAMQYAMNLMASLDDPTITDALNAAGIGCADVHQVTDVSSLLETKFERHATFDFEINVPSNVLSSDTGVIDSVTMPAFP